MSSIKLKVINFKIFLTLVATIFLNVKCNAKEKDKFAEILFKNYLSKDILGGTYSSKEADFGIELSCRISPRVLRDYLKFSCMLETKNKNGKFETKTSDIADKFYIKLGAPFKLKYSNLAFGITGAEDDYIIHLSDNGKLSPNFKLYIDIFDKKRDCNSSLKFGTLFFISLKSAFSEKFKSDGMELNIFKPYFKLDTLVLKKVNAKLELSAGYREFWVPEMHFFANNKWYVEFSKNFKIKEYLRSEIFGKLKAKQFIVIPMLIESEKNIDRIAWFKLACKEKISSIKNLKEYNSIPSVIMTLKPYVEVGIKNGGFFCRYKAGFESYELLTFDDDIFLFNTQLCFGCQF